MRPLLLISFCSFIAVSVSATEEIPFALHPERGVVLIEGRINSESVQFLLDTGATVSLIDVEMTATPFEVKAARFNRNAPGIEVKGKVVEASIEVAGGKSFRRHVAAVDFTQIRALYGDRVRGLLGQDYLRSFRRVAFDFDRRQLELVKR